MNGIFIGYRVEDSKLWAARLADTLTHLVDPQVPVFRDASEIRAGESWMKRIQDALDASDVFLLMIGPKWLSDPSRIKDSSDIHRQEIEVAIDRDMLIVPVLVDDADLPDETDLPDSLRPILSTQSFRLTDRNWEKQCTELLESCEEEINSRNEASEENPPEQSKEPDYLIVGRKEYFRSKFGQHPVLWSTVGIAVIGTAFYAFSDSTPDAAPKLGTNAVATVSMSSSQPESTSAKVTDQKTTPLTATTSDPSGQSASQSTDKAKELISDAAKSIGDAVLSGADKAISKAGDRGAAKPEEGNAGSTKDSAITTKPTGAGPEAPRKGEIKTLDHLVKLANQGDARAVIALAKHYEKKGDYSQAVARWGQALKLGKSEAALNIGLAYQNGRGVVSNPRTALSYFVTAGQGGVPAGYREAGMMHLVGAGVPVNMQEAARLLKMAAKAGDRQARKKLERLKIMY